MSTVLAETQTDTRASRKEAAWDLMPRWLDRIGLPLLLAGSLSTMVAAALA